MANKRMFSLTIVDSDVFTEMGNDSQLLYFRLCLAADDDGFVSNPRKVMRAYGFRDSDMRELIDRKFTLVMTHAQTAILLIKHWRMHNTIQKDRYKPSPYHDLLRFFFLDENNAYSLTPGEGKRQALQHAKNTETELDTSCIQNVYTDKYRLDKDRLGLDKYRLDKDRLGLEENRENNISSSINQSEENDESDQEPEWVVRARETAKRLGIYKEGGTA